MLATTLLGFTISTIWSVILLIVWIAIAIWPASIAKNKGYSFLLFFIISIPFWWITIFVALLLKDKTQGNAPTPPASPSAE